MFLFYVYFGVPPRVSSRRNIGITLREQPRLARRLRIVLQCELAWCFAPSFYVYFFTAARNVLLLARGL